MITITIDRMNINTLALVHGQLYFQGEACEFIPGKFGMLSCFKRVTIQPNTKLISNTQATMEMLCFL